MKILKNFLKHKVDKDLFELLVHGKNYISADIFSKGLSIISIPIFTRLLIPADYGILAIYTSFVAMFTIVAGLGVRQSVTRYYYEKNNDFEKFYGSILIFNISWSFFVCLLLFLLKNHIKVYLNIPEDVLNIGILVVLFSTTFEIYKAYLQAAKQSKKISKLTIIRASIFLIFSIIFTILMKNHRYLGKTYSQLFIWFIFYIYSIYAIVKISEISFEYRYIKYSLILGIPLVFHLLSQYILSSFDQIIINQLVGAESTGLYSLAYKVGMLQNILSMAILKAWTPIFYGKLNENKNDELDKLAKNYSRIVFMIALALILFSRELILILADKKYYAALNIIPVIIVSYLFFFFYTIYVNYSFYVKKTFLVAIITIIAGIVNISLNYLLIPKFGYMIAAWTTLISYFLLFLLHFINSKYIIKVKNIINPLVFIPNFLYLLLCISVYFIIGKIVINTWFYFIIKIVIFLIFIFWVFRKNILQKLYEE